VEATIAFLPLRIHRGVFGRRGVSLVLNGAKFAPFPLSLYSGPGAPRGANELITYALDDPTLGARQSSEDFFLGFAFDG
jgi:hypothetical protein